MCVSAHHALNDRKAIVDLMEAHPLGALVAHRDEAQAVAGPVAKALGIRN